MEPTRLKLGHIISDRMYALSIREKLTQFIGQNYGVDSPLYVVKHEGWSARAFYDGEFYEENQEEALANVLQEHDYTSFLMVPFYEDLSDESMTLTLDLLQEPSTYEGFEEVRLNHCLDWYILCGGQPDWLILLTPVDDFMIVMGKDKIFDAICSNFSSDVWLRIEEMSNFHKSRSNQRFIFTNLIRCLNDTYTSAISGEILNIDLVRLKES
jgi:hypothetical protein